MPEGEAQCSSGWVMQAPELVNQVASASLRFWRVWGSKINIRFLVIVFNSFRHIKSLATIFACTFSCCRCCRLELHSLIILYPSYIAVPKEIMSLPRVYWYIFWVERAPGPSCLNDPEILAPEPHFQHCHPLPSAGVLQQHLHHALVCAEGFFGSTSPERER